MNLLLEWLTHALLGAIITEWLLGRKVGPVAMQWGALLGTAPDLLEVPPALFLNNLHTLQWQQGPLHSLVAAALAAWGASQWIARSWKKQKVTRGDAFRWVFAVWATHSLWDTLTTGGAAILWPIPGFPARVSCNLLAVWGGVPALILLATLVRMARLKTKKEIPLRRKALIRGSAVTAAWLLVCAGLKLLGHAGFQADLDRRESKVRRLFETPVGYNLLLRRAVVEDGDGFRIGYRSVFEPFSSTVRWTTYPSAVQPATVHTPADAAFATLHRQTGGWAIRRSHTRGWWVADLRHAEHRVWGERKGMVDSRFPRTWNLLADSRGDILQPLGAIRQNPLEQARRGLARTFGRRDAWEGIPRLAGVTGSLPESLASD